MVTIIACVRTGTAYPFEYVIKLRNMVQLHMHRPFELVCMTDQPERCDGVTFIDIAEIALPGWWAKLILFAPEWRALHKIVYFDLDTLIINDITPLADVPGEFAILESPVRQAGIASYPCKYNSSVMVIGAGMASFVWTRFDRQRDQLMARHERYGDQKVIEELYPSALFLAPLLPKNFFINYRYLTMHRPQASVVNFGGSHKPANCQIPWVQQQWA
jgi:hypothetical protein